MKISIAVVLLVLTAGASADDGGLGKMYDGSPSSKDPRFEAVAPPAPSAASEEKRVPTIVPPELSAAKGRVGIDVQLARLGTSTGAKPFTFGVIGDAERGRFPWERIFSPGPNVFSDQMGALQAASPDFIFQLGDFVSEGTPANYRDHVAWLDAHPGPPLLRCIGNHDRSRPNGDADKNMYDAVFGPRDYFFDHDGWRFIALDSSDRKLTPAQLAWLKTALDSPARKVIFTHVPPKYLKKLKPLAAVGALETDSAQFNAMQAEDRKNGGVHDFFTNYFEDGSDEFENLVTHGNVAAVYMGHIHAFWAADYRGVRYVISGGGGSPLYPLPPG
ncbi:MAG: metallophosphoesterase, partial [Elusimicrobia bacterium]|nr:metallophosphoesterase [Elusimicrobiota bacterium]